MKILLCHNFYQQAGGEQVAVLALKALLENKGHHVIFYIEDNEKIKHYNGLQKVGFFPRTLFSTRTYRCIRQIAAREKPDVAHVHNVFPLLSPSMYVALNRSGIPIVQTIHNYRLMCINGLFLRDGRICELCKNGKFFSGFRFKCYKSSYTLSGLYALALSSHRGWGTFNRIDHFIALSHFAATKLVESGVTDQSKISILENFLPMPLPDYGEADLRDPYIVYIGRLSHEKGIFTLLEAFRRMTSLRLKILGAGPMGEAIRDYIREHKLENVDILGFVNGEEKYRILREALCSVVPSECYENFPYAVLETAAVGTPVIASRIGALATIIAEGETGLLFAPGNGAELRAKLELLAAKPEMATRMGRHARHWVERKHTPDAHYEGLMKIYRQLPR
jgi:glycosyltransferase involved in cell wall biosynthesis